MSCVRSYSHGRINHATSANSPRQWYYKVVALGNSGIGKTWLIQTLVAGQTSTGENKDNNTDSQQTSEAVDSQGTVGVTVNLSKVLLIDVETKVAKIDCTKASNCTRSNTVLLNIWDTSGKSSYRNLVRNYIHDAHCILLVYNPSEGSEAAQKSLVDWYRFVKEAASNGAVTNGPDGDTGRELKSSISTGQDPQALILVVAIANGACPYTMSPTVMEGVNFGRVFASSVCGRFFLVQRPSSCSLPHHLDQNQQLCQRGVQLSIKQTFNSRILAEVLLKHQLTKQGRELLKNQIASSQQSLMLSKLTRHKGESQVNEDDNGCSWCDWILFGCRRKRKK